MAFEDHLFSSCKNVGEVRKLWMDAQLGEKILAGQSVWMRSWLAALSDIQAQ